MNQPLILLRDIHVALTRKSSAEHDAEALEIAQKRYRRTLSKAFGEADFFVYKKSVDARNKNKIFYIYTVSMVPREVI